MPQPVSESTNSESVVAVVMDFVGATLPQFDQLLESMRLRPEGPGMSGQPLSVVERYAGRRTGHRGLAIASSLRGLVREEVEPRLSDIGLREPEITTYEVHSYLTQGPTADQQARGEADRHSEP